VQDLFWLACADAVRLEPVVASLAQSELADEVDGSKNPDDGSTCEDPGHQEEWVHGLRHGSRMCFRSRTNEYRRAETFLEPPTMHILEY
jgi:hypothetical protein